MLSALRHGDRRRALPVTVSFVVSWQHATRSERARGVRSLAGDANLYRLGPRTGVHRNGSAERRIGRAMSRTRLLHGDELGARRQPQPGPDLKLAEQEPECR